ncbi:hypothetical protein F5Y19DRAFT_445132 [Xylariaceae sp. FL1651]|nr:hypothetical protein F5Y19DRAFT_445132 [Xylariaceae sp. FL1651]
MFYLRSAKKMKRVLYCAKRMSENLIQYLKPSENPFHLVQTVISLELTRCGHNL